MHQIRPNWIKAKEARISTSTDTENCLMTSDFKVMMLSKYFGFRDFVLNYHHARFGGSWTTNESPCQYFTKIAQPE